MSGREGVCDTSVNTSTSGYIQRKLVKLLEDVCGYGTVRNHMGDVFQNAYGSKGLVDVHALVSKLTLEKGDGKNHRGGKAISLLNKWTFLNRYVDEFVIWKFKKKQKHYGPNMIKIIVGRS